jgi:purine-binding chemotaxis protein CheW
MTLEDINQQTKAANAAQASQFLTFSLADEEYGVDILKVQEIKAYVPTTRIPNAPAEVTGVLNLRGTIVPIVDLRTKFGLPEATYDQFTVIVIVVVQERVMGMIVDSVSEVMNIALQDIQPAPDLGKKSAKGLKGLGKVEDKLIILLDIDAVLLEDAQVTHAA